MSKNGLFAVRLTVMGRERGLAPLVLTIGKFLLITKGLKTVFLYQKKPVFCTH